jgi:hypothetical protein
MTLIRPRTSLETAAEVFEALGGNPGVRRLTGCTYQQASNWRARGAFPTDTFLIFDQALKRKRKGYRAPPALWGMREPAGAVS